MAIAIAEALLKLLVVDKEFTSDLNHTLWGVSFFFSMES
jgi:hypothetical protein